MSNKGKKEIVGSELQIEERLEAMRGLLVKRQQLIKQEKLPVIVVLGGFGAAGKGSILGKVIKNMDPRFFKVENLGEDDDEERRKPFLYSYFRRIPEAGRFSFFDGSWMDDIVKEKCHGELKQAEYKAKLDSVIRFERTLVDNGYLVIKLFFDIDQDEQKRRLNKLEADKDTKWRVSEEDRWQNRHYDAYKVAYTSFIEQTNQEYARWHVISSYDKKTAQLQLMELIVNGIDAAIKKKDSRKTPIIDNAFPLLNMPKLDEIALDKELSDEEYRAKLKKCQKRLKKLHNRLYRKKLPVIIAYEGWDAAGKGGNIKRIAGALDPRGCEVHPIASPEPHEKNRHYLWRFWTRLPKTGHIAIFDRTWYGRVMVERLEGFCSENEWQRAYNEINEFEEELSRWGAVIIKFWVQIDKETQLERFMERQNTPEKQWKITDEDWRNREKWDLYETAVNEMLQKTSTEYAPWIILESNDKKYARIKAMNAVIERIEQAISG